MENLSQQKISVVFGGVSTERDLSLRAFNSIYTELQKQTQANNHYQFVYYINEDGFVIKKPVNFNKDPDFYIRGQGKSLTVLEALHQIKKNDEYVFSLLYGLYGEDGHFQGLGKALNIKSSFGSVLSCSLSKSKYHCSKYIESNYSQLEPIPVIPIREEDIDSIKEKLFPFYEQEIVVKPNALGTSMLTERFFLNDRSIHDVFNLIATILKYDDIALVQKYIAGEEYSCGCIENLNTVEVLPLILVRTKDGFFGRREKLCKYGVSERIVSSHYNQYTAQIADISKRIFADLKFENMFRLDFIVSEGKIYFLEVNSLPGLTHASFFPKMLREVNISISDFIKLTYQNSLRRKNKESNFNYDMDWRSISCNV
ncbi:ATP-grasp domain-containing protein [Legionella bozemanae]|uniref:ATP-grasp domain-containing protein n=1 Tax=Legionella bozemanae TaxID=447 RepID=UPI00104186C9|nr:ATP-grasp domain-containing protein [Legionella bozemanae]